GSFALVRMRGRGESKPQWLVIKHRDDDAVPGWDITEHDTSVTTGRTMDEIANGNSKGWHSNRGKKSVSAPTRQSKPSVHRTRLSMPASRITPMMASIGTEI